MNYMSQLLDYYLWVLSLTKESLDTLHVEKS